STHIAVTRVGGVTSVLSMPSGGTISGQAAFINLAGSSPREMAVVPEAALVIQFPTLGGGGGFAAFLAQQQGITPDAVTARDRRIEELRRLLRDAEAYGRAQDAYRKDPKSVPRPTTDLKLAALVPYARGERPVIFRAERQREIRAVVRVRDLPFQAGMAAAYGLPKPEALKAVTIYPAQIMGVASQLGSIEQGKLANLFITDGDPLEPRTNIKYLFINGRQIPLTSRHTMLNDEFKDRK